MARIWSNGACKSRHAVAQQDRGEFMKTLETRQQTSPKTLKVIEISMNYELSFQSKYSASVVSERFYLIDYKMLCEYDHRSSIEAKNFSSTSNSFA
ncbi:unnamed protein product [Adineta ricciae]|uniref:Uncharacterized protein n=1 Tax=Adineta ricciae TaxID=249248 RepID=A0A815N757_ADIRI|nr:unnamed protein product [Adineta ricciae]CAF1433486.1 unnamed protein product [Adineta ricciae]